MNTTLCDLAKYRLGQKLYRLDLRTATRVPSELHAKAWAARNDYAWPVRFKRPPSLIGADFDAVVGVLSSSPRVVECIPDALARDEYSGEMLYWSGVDGLWIPESTLMGTRKEAYAELYRIKRMIRAWADS